MRGKRVFICLVEIFPLKNKTASFAIKKQALSLSETDILGKKT